MFGERWRILGEYLLRSYTTKKKDGDTAAKKNPQKTTPISQEGWTAKLSSEPLSYEQMLPRGGLGRMTALTGA